MRTVWCKNLNEGHKKELQEIVEKFNRPHIMWLAIVLLWIGLLITNYTIDSRFLEINNFVNEECNTWNYMAFDINSSSPIYEHDLNMSDVPVLIK